MEWSQCRWEEHHTAYMNGLPLGGPQPTNVVGVLGLENEATMTSPETSHTVQLPSGTAVTETEKRQWLVLLMDTLCHNDEWTIYDRGRHVTMAMSRCVTLEGGHTMTAVFEVLQWRVGGL